MKRIIMHWTASGDEVTGNDREHYHEIVDRQGRRVLGIHKPEANLKPKKGKYAAHTRALNTGSIGLAMDCMANAKERPFNPGTAPMTQKQLDAFLLMVAEYCDTYKIPVTRKTVLTHAEVQPTLGVWQRGKWDINWIPGWTKSVSPVAAGDALRTQVSKHLETIQRKQRRPWWRSLFGR